MGLFGMKNRYDVQKMIVDHIDAIDASVSKLEVSEVVNEINWQTELAAYAKAKSTALQALTSTLQKEK
ncbi:hypothetical protein D3C75_474260 [compost metagenome]